MFRGVGASWLVTTSPHCFNTFKNEYGLDGIEVLHYTQLVAELIEQGQLEFSASPLPPPPRSLCFETSGVPSGVRAQGSAPGANCPLAET